MKINNVESKELPSKVRENFARREADRLGYKLQKSRAKKISIDNLGGYRVIDFDNNIQAGERYEMTLDDVESFLANEQKILEDSIGKKDPDAIYSKR